ncbi:MULTISPECIES: hypothetical protein [Bacillus]|uniref:hypothetical protein n=1 Tax=Bacillus TaxID=1386 RepID=UPI00091064E6|nr:MULTISPECIES: hypothetical protein [Bacillus]KAB2364278.1 hypothetical protein F8517_25630 [Bacillus thuringiensis]MCU5131695.1 hypothetical protein [Bacillus cereus]MCU5528069.1 hypothetical protein [Bacillus cereus]MCU5544534.1 hypothetical protein [Bacillus cereus]MDA1871899.1 hypothetical protein [Bacillus cereus]
MKKVISDNFASFFCIGLLLYLSIDYKNISIMGYIFIATSIFAFITFLINLALTYQLEKREKESI